MFSSFFIDRPIFASVLSIVLVIGGVVAGLTLPIAQYPEITPPTVSVTAYYPGADARVVADTVAAPIEQQVNGVERMLYMNSSSNADGSYSLNVTFELGTDIDIAQVLVQNRVAIANPQLPDAVRQTGVTVKKKSPSILLMVNLYSPDGRYDALYLSNYATLQVRDELSRLKGVGDVAMLGQRDYAMRLWLDPDRMASLGLGATDIIIALKEQNVQVAAGKLGQPPAPAGQAFEYTLTTLGRLVEAEQFADIVVKTGPDGQLVRLRDVGRAELGAKDLNQDVTLDGKPSVALAVFALPGANALATADLIERKMEELKRRFPSGIDYAIIYDTTPFINESVHEVFKALRDAIILVAIVVLVFLQNWRSALIPLIAVPVSIVGTFLVMAALGYSINNLTLFGLVLAIGIVVDDAIVVVEAVELNMEKGMNAREASILAMQQVGGALVAIGFVLAAVFVPAMFITGITGEFFRQFAVTIAVSAVISAFNSLTLSPALSALLLRPKHAPQDILTRLINLVLGWFFRLFNRTFDIATAGYAWIVGKMIRLAVIVLVVYAGLLFGTFKGLTSVPTGFIPNQDKGYLLVDIRLPDSASLERTINVVSRVREIASETSGVRHVIGVSGQSFALSQMSSNLGSVFVVLEDFEHRRRSPELYADVVAGVLQRALFVEIPEVQIAVYGAPPVDGLGNAGGFKLMVQDRGNAGIVELERESTALAGAISEDPPVRVALAGFNARSPQFFVDIDRAKVKSMGVQLSDVFSTLSLFLGGAYVNDFNQFGRTWQVRAQADAAFRLDPEQVGHLRVRSAKGEMVPLGSFTTVRESVGPPSIIRYNSYPAAPITGVPRPGVSSGDVIDVVRRIADDNLSPAMGFEWTELTLLQILAGSTAILAFGGSVVFVFLVLSAQYESWSLPLSVILVVPMCLLFSVLGVAITGSDVNIFVQIGFIVLVGLASKNAILIVEYARELQDRDGKSVFDAAVDASRLRLRPILMTSFAFILGVVPLVLASGAGAEMRTTLGVAVFSGMLGVTFFGIFLTPVFYFVVRKLSPSKPKPSSDADAAPTVAADARDGH
jgi:multidrug efflux pump